MTYHENRQFANSPLTVNEEDTVRIIGIQYQMIVQSKRFDMLIGILLFC